MKKGQMKIQQMAFVLVAIMIFFALVALFYFSIKTKSYTQSAASLREEETSILVKKITGTAEFSWTASECRDCVDFDKILALKYRMQNYSALWKEIPYLKIEKIYPGTKKAECSLANYPDCSTITLINSDKPFSSKGAYVALCRFEQEKGGYTKCELGKIEMAFLTEK